MKRVLGISGSPRKNGNSETALSRVIEKCQNQIITNSFNVSQMNIGLCDGCLACEEVGVCHQQDDMSNLLSEIEIADLIIVSTPVYFDGLPAVLKNILDRTNPLCSRISGKEAYILTFGQADETSWERACTCLENYFEVMNIKVIGKNSFYAREMNDVMKNEEILNKLDRISYTIIERCLESK